MHIRMSLVAAAALLALSPWPAQAQEISGPAEASDGDSLTMTDTRIRLFGIDAVEARQSCVRDGAPWPCGEEAKARLAELIAGGQVTCIGRETDQYGRLVATCRVGTTDLGKAMVLSGLALAYREISETYVDAEERARKFRLGIWAGTFETPARWRRTNPDARPRSSRVSSPSTEWSATNTTSAGAVYRDGLGRCAIKGNHSRRGEWIYHLPGQPYYEQTRPEALFCTEDAALAAGYRPSRAN